MNLRNHIQYIRELITEFKAKEIVPSKEEENIVWNNILQEIQVARIRRRTYRLKVAFGSISAAAMLVGAIWAVHLHFYENKNDIDKHYAAISNIATTATDKILLLEDNNQLSYIRKDDVIDYKQSEKQVIIGGKSIDKNKEYKLHQLIVPSKQQAHLVLSDGSTLHINASTRVIYPNKFKKGNREIYVDGEIFIDVKPDKTAPFIVKTHSCDIQVLGTAFNVQSYSTDENSEVALLRGSIKLKDNSNGELLLKPNELAMISNTSIIGKKDVVASDYIAWTNQEMKLNATPLSTIFKRLEKFYGVTIEYDPNVGEMKMYGNLSLKCSIRELLNRLEFTVPIIAHEISANTFHISVTK